MLITFTDFHTQIKHSQTVQSKVGTRLSGDKGAQLALSCQWKLGVLRAFFVCK